MNGLLLILIALALCGVVAALSFRAPAGVYGRTVATLFLFLVGVIALAPRLLSPLLGDGAGLGVALILDAAAALAVALAVAAILGASAGYLWKWLRR